MMLQIEEVEINDIKVGSKTHVENHVLNIDLKELEKVILQDNRIKGVELNVLYPRQRVRVVNVVDVIQPRCKIDREDGNFPGWLDTITPVGNGRTRSLIGISVILSNRFSKRPYSAVLDMFGSIAEMVTYAKMKNISVAPIPAEDVGEREFESAVKIAGLKAAVYLAKATQAQAPDSVRVFDLDKQNSIKSTLTKVAYYYQIYTPQHDYQGISDPILYGSEVTNMFPTIIHPNEVLDGAVVNPHTVRGMETFSIQNHPIITELYRRHGKDLNFVGVVVGVACMDPIQRKRMVMMAASLISNILGAENVILTKVHGGMARVDLPLIAEACETRGIKSTLLINVGYSGSPLADGALYESPYLNAVVNVGQTLEKIKLPQADSIIGGDINTVVYNPERVQKAGDESIEIEGMLLAGLYSYLGGANVIAIDY